MTTDATGQQGERWSDGQAAARHDWSNGPVVAHLDLDCFFAQVVQLDDPSLRGKPVIVGGGRRPDGSFGRGVVCTSNYEARAHGVRTAMPIARAAALCPHAVITHAAPGRYETMSRAVMDVCRRFTPDVRVVGIDEAYLDFTGLDRWTLAQMGASGRPWPAYWSLDWPVELARRIQDAIETETGLTASLGVGANHFVAKIASGFRKPRGVTVVRPAQSAAFIASLPLRKLRGVGPVMEERLQRRGYTRAAHIVDADPEQIAADLGDFGLDLWRKAHAEPIPSSTARPRQRRSISRERTFGEDVFDRRELLTTLSGLTERATWTLRRKGLAAGCVSVKLRYGDFTTVTRDRSLAAAEAGAIGCSDQDADVYPVASALLADLLTRGRRTQGVRLVGVKLSQLSEGGHRQMRLGESEQFERRAALYAAADAIRDRFGFDVVSMGSGRESARLTRRTARSHDEHQ